MSSLDLAHWRSWIGRSEETEDIVTPRLIAGFDATLAPHLAPVAAPQAPLAIHWCLAPPATPIAALGADGHAAKGGFLPPVPLPRRMWAGGEVVTHASLHAGDRVVRRSTISDVTAKDGRSGALCFVAVYHDYLTDRGLAIRERHDIVYRDAAGSGAKPAAPVAPAAASAPAADLVWSVDASPVLLFRYSALTFNGHRIHYDHPYVTGVEGYAGLVVHGPLQATLLFNLAAVLGDRAPARFTYRGLAPMTAGQCFEVCGARKTDGSVECWTRDAGGRTNMAGIATW